jgi:hypothetical protein
MAARRAYKLVLSAALLALYGCGSGDGSSGGGGAAAAGGHNASAGSDAVGGTDAAAGADAVAGSDTSGGASEATGEGGIGAAAGSDAAGGVDTGGVGDAGAPNVGSGGPTDDDFDLIAAIEAEYLLLAPRSNPDQEPAMIAYASALPNVAQAGWTDAAHGDNFYVVLQDGTPFAILDNVIEAPESALSVSPPPPPLASTKVVPMAPTAHVLFSLGNAFTNSTSTLQAMLVPAGYNVVTGSGDLATLDAGIAGDGYFLWDTHSGWLTEGKVLSPIICTSTEFSKAVNKTALIQRLWAEGTITLSGSATDVVPNPKDTNKNGKIDHEEQFVIKNVYAIRPSFISKHFKFADNSVVLQDSCTSADAAFSNAYIAANAGLYGGWDNVAQSSTRMSLFTDRMLGANTVAPIETPPERPFEAAKVIAWMRKFGLDRAGSAKLQLSSKPGFDAGILAPSIQSVRVTEGLLRGAQSTVTINGIFGPRDDGKYKRELTIGGKSANITGGDDLTIIADIPTTGTGSVGLCVVTVAGRISNEVPLSLYDIPMTYTLIGADKLKISETIHYYVRMDVHQFRTDVGAPLSGDLEIISERSDSIGTFSATGSSSAAGCTSTWAGSGTVQVPASLSVQPSVTLNGVLDVAGQVSLAFVPTFNPDPDAVIQTTTCGTDPPNMRSIDAAVHYSPDPSIELVPPSGVLLPGSATYSGADGKGTLTWSTALAMPSPDAKTKG